ncbi:penicillin-binding protein 2 [Candidatus Uhrbacteria bacterium]|nr:penicillin-binding protein 2 [Candidatus Uhrbacteria bacterium]
MSALFRFGSHGGGADVVRQEAFALSPDVLCDTHGASLAPRAFGLRQYLFALVLVGVACAVLLGRAAYLQVFRGASFRVVAEENRTRLIVFPAERGVIYSADKTLLARNEPSFTLFVTPDDLPEDLEERRRVIEEAAGMVSIAPPEIEFALAEFPDAAGEAIPVTGEITYERAVRFLVAEERLPGLSMRMETRRAYATSALRSLSHVLGYTGFISQEEYTTRRSQGYRRVDRVGKTGVEATYEEALHGVHGARVVEVDARGNETRLIRFEPAQNGSNLSLSIDAGLTGFIENRLEEFFRRSGLNRASVIALDPRDGAVRALVSLPSYDNNLFSGRVSPDMYNELSLDPDHPLFSRAVSGEFPPGSTFKPTVAAVALYDGVIDERTSFLSTGGVRIGEWFFPDWKAGGHGVTDVRKALAESVNTFFYAVGGGLGEFRGLGIERLREAVRAFGFGQTLQADLPGEAEGFLPSKTWKESAKGERWYIGDTYHAAIGQGDVLVTPLQMAVATATIANGGVRYAPHVVSSLERDGVETSVEPAVVERLAGYEEALRVVREGMRQAVTVGSARMLESLPVAVAAKTGTAQTPGDKPTHAWFTSFGPYEAPELVVTVLIEEGGEGSAVAAPLARDIYAWWSANRGFSNDLDDIFERR